MNESNNPTQAIANIADDNSDASANDVNDTTSVTSSSYSYSTITTNTAQSSEYNVTREQRTTDMVLGQQTNTLGIMRFLVTQLETFEAKFDRGMKNMTDRMDRLENRFNQVEQKVTDFSSEVEAGKRTIADAVLQITSHSNTVSSNSANINTNTNKLQSHDADINQLKLDKAQHVGFFNAATTDRNNIRATANSNSAEITTIKTKFNRHFHYETRYGSQSTFGPMDPNITHRTLFSVRKGPMIM